MCTVQDHWNWAQKCTFLVYSHIPVVYKKEHNCFLLWFHLFVFYTHKSTHYLVIGNCIMRWTLRGKKRRITLPLNRCWIGFTGICFTLNAVKACIRTYHGKRLAHGKVNQSTAQNALKIALQTLRLAYVAWKLLNIISNYVLLKWTNFYYLVLLSWYLLVVYYRYSIAESLVKPRGNIDKTLHVGTFWTH